MEKKVSEALFEATKTLNNIKEHNYSVQDYKMCEKEADIVCKALRKYIEEIKFDGLDVVTAMERSTEESFNALVDCIHVKN